MEKLTQQELSAILDAIEIARKNAWGQPEFCATLNSAAKKIKRDIALD